MNESKIVMKSTRIVIVDDNEIVRSSLELLIKSQLGVETLSFEDGNQFLAFVDQNNIVDCLLIDLRMPKISGITLLQELDQRGLQIPTIVISGHFDPRQQREFPGFVVATFNKPYRTTDLTECIKANFDSHTMVS